MSLDDIVEARIILTIVAGEPLGIKFLEAHDRLQSAGANLLGNEEAERREIGVAGGNSPDNIGRAPTLENGRDIETALRPILLIGAF